MDPLNEIKAKLKTRTKVQLAKELNISPGFLGDLVSRRRPISDNVLQALGLERVVTYRRVRNGSQSDARQ